MNKILIAVVAAFLLVFAAPAMARGSGGGHGGGGHASGHGFGHASEGGGGHSEGGGVARGGPTAYKGTSRPVYFFGGGSSYHPVTGQACTEQAPCPEEPWTFWDYVIATLFWVFVIFMILVVIVGLSLGE